MNDGGKIRSFTDLNAWREGHRLVLIIYSLTKRFPQEEIFALTNQLRRAAISVTSNIAEGFSRRSYKEKIHFYSISSGSIAEIQNQLLLAKDIKYLDNDFFQKTAEQTITVHKLVNGLIKGCRNHNS